MNQFRERAIELRKAGYSYSIIKERLGVHVAKSTLSNWLGNIPFEPNQEVIGKIGSAKLKSALFKQNIKFTNTKRMHEIAVTDVGKLTDRDIFMLGTGLYLGEGSKAQEQVRIVNADPVILKVAIKWLKKFGDLKNTNFRVAIHGYPDQDPAELVSYWSKTLNIPANQFIKITIDTRTDKLITKKRKLPYGTAHLYIIKNGTLLIGVKNLHRKIIGWINAIVVQI